MEQETKIKKPQEDVAKDTHMTACESMPDFTRLRYFHGQLLGYHDFQNEQDYFREKLKLLNRCLQGYGTVCGLKVVPVEREEDCDPPPQYLEKSEAEKQPYAQAPVEYYDVAKSGEDKQANDWDKKRRPLLVNIE